MTTKQITKSIVAQRSTNLIIDSYTQSYTQKIGAAIAHDQHSGDLIAAQGLMFT